MNENRVRTYLLENINLDEKRSMGELLIHHQKTMLALTLVFLGLAYFYAIIANAVNDLTGIIFYLLLLLLIPINVILSLKLCIKHLVKFKPNVTTKNKPDDSFLSKMPYKNFAGMGVVISVWTSRNISQEVRGIIGIFLLTFIIMLFTHFFSACAYKFYLLKKYCPDLMKYRLPKEKK